MEGRLGRESFSLFTKEKQKRSQRDTSRVVMLSASSFEAGRVTDLPEARLQMVVEPNRHGEENAPHLTMQSAEAVRAS